MVKKISIVMCVFLVSATGLAGLPHYEAEPYISEWGTTGNVLRCSLSHDIPLYGRAEFQRLAGKSLSFRIHVKEKPVRRGKAVLQSVPPDWKHETQILDLGSIKYKAGRTPYVFKRKLALRMLSELEKGMTPTISFQDLGDGRDEVSVTVSPVNFLASLEDFRSCLNDLLPYDFDKVKNTKVYFKTNKHDLSNKAKYKLDGIIAYLNVDQSLLDKPVKNVLIEGHADDRGKHRENDLLSNRRASSVRDYLLENKIERSRLKLRFYGKRKPESSKRTKAARAKNRRVFVTLIQ